MPAPLSEICYLDAVLTFNAFFAHLQLQQNALTAQEQAKVANEKLSTLSTTGKSKQVLFLLSSSCTVPLFVTRHIVGILVCFQIFLQPFDVTAWFIACNFQEVAYEFLCNVLVETRGINVEMDQSRSSLDSALSFIDELCQNLSTMSQSILVC